MLEYYPLFKHVPEKIDFEKLGLNIPIISAIVERFNEKLEETEILVQTRWQPEFDKKYSGTLELQAGWIEHYEDVYDAIRREVYEETGLKVKDIKPDKRTAVHSPSDDGAFAFEPFCCVQQLKNGQPWMGFVFVCSVEGGEPRNLEDETRRVRWTLRKTLRNMYEKNPKKIFTLQLPILEKYFAKVDELSPEKRHLPLNEFL
jgi:8-oxo-dGTP pyrophosphatase MutT (NUDIX family)